MDALATPATHSSPSSTKTVVVLGAAYAGHRATQLLIGSLPSGWRVVVIERNTHFNHLYAFSRVSVLPGHEHKPFIPYTNLLRTEQDLAEPRSTKCRNSCPHQLLHANIIKLEPHRVHFKYLGEDNAEKEADSIEFDYCVYALGSSLPPPINVWSTSEESRKKPKHSGIWHGTKPEGRQYLRDEQDRIRAAKSIAIVGGGALGIQYASDIADIYPNKQVTLVHSRHQLLPQFDHWMHDAAARALTEMNVRLVLGSRLNLDDVDPDVMDEGRVLKTASGESIPAELILICTGQKPNTHFIRDMAPSTINPSNNLVYVRRTLQLADPPEYEDEDPLVTHYPHIFVVGDAADAFGALKAGHTAWQMAAVAAYNVVALIRGEDELQEYTPPPPAIKVSLGLTQAIYQSRGVHGHQGAEQCDEALNTHVMWTRRGLSTEDMTI
ncbi:hypothetical protein EV121DRAFT_252137 [Schizophyllum commune]